MLRGRRPDARYTVEVVDCEDSSSAPPPWEFALDGKKVDAIQVAPSVAREDTVFSF